MKNRPTFKTREEWLNVVADMMAPWFTELGHSIPTIRIAIGFPSTGRRGRRIGECWDSAASEDNTFEILIRPDQCDALEVAAILAHEMIHAVVGLKAGHGPAFRKVALAIGLEGKMTATVPGDRFKAAAAPILQQVGPLPHARLTLGVSSGPKKQTTRMVKAECAECGYTVRLARKWAVDVGAPTCGNPDHGKMTVQLPADEDAPEDEGAGE